MGVRGGRLRRGPDGLAAPDGTRDRAGRHARRRAPGDGRRAAARSGLRAVRPARAGGRDPGRSRVRWVRVLHRAGTGRARGGGVAGDHGADDVRGARLLRSSSPTATRPASCAGPASGTACSNTRRPGVLSCSSATASRTATRPGMRISCGPKRSLVRICIEAGWEYRRWTEFREIDAWLEFGAGGVARGSGQPARPPRPAVLLRTRGLGRRSRRPGPRRVAAEDRVARKATGQRPGRDLRAIGLASRTSRRRSARLRTPRSVVSGTAHSPASGNGPGTSPRYIGCARGPSSCSRS